ncbi:lipopolysaccharide/colanic/teichoic acid biosynthesis glycosyltransferase [Planomicrobium soli]|uniref:Lipopolysaccharide/colanic/teichoic acid biosynthesis glycosyltransferase n=1 Tax=Planomicrobium soli TaxID=1176648 RepID=A0A2P8H3L2_9BACL|nr:sugar transferase [Planomicrobium soli]PSL40790.1 lipopolysaccharide/colanic/teichoic acid biosynthesis glycosyltransferase [Planomicrobium soli]
MEVSKIGPERKNRKSIERLQRTSEFLCASVMLCSLAPLFVVVGIAIRLESKGSIFFKQVRGGKMGHHFTIYKFRTMYDEPEKRNDNIAVLTTDSRITKVGHFLRKTSIDELPQLINIVKGDMSFVGPRPTLTVQTDNYNDYQKQRLSVKPGVTGWAQISGRNALTWDEKIELDIEYIERRSIRFDLYILFQTAIKVLKSDGVYSDSIE